MTTAELRKLYLTFFKEKNHKAFPSDSLVPDDESVLFTSAGMNQFKPYFMGEKKDCTRATSCQKCLRTGDIDEVGKTPFHHTFFEMLGNFSFGDYFKKVAIECAWEFLTKRLNIKPDLLMFSVYKDDDEAYGIWTDHIGVAPDKVVRLDQKSNFWPANAPALGPNGPCGPCSEIFFDKGKHLGCQGPQCGPACSCGRFVEIWNLVFTQFNRIGENQLEPLPQKNIDTGMGLERMASVLQGKESNFEIDILAPVVKFSRDILKADAQDPQTISLLHAIVDHIRAATFAIADGVQPSNEDRGYVIRKLIRIALWKMDMLKGLKTGQLNKFPEQFAMLMGDFYPEIKEKKDMIAQVLDEEERKFQLTLSDGQKRITEIVEGLKQTGKTTIDDQETFRLYDTYGVPLELSIGIAQKNGMTVDEAGFNVLLEKQKESSRKKSMFDANIFKEKEFNITEKTIFTGYEMLQTASKIVRLFSGSQEAQMLAAGDAGFIVVEKTPLYAESGGQLADKGVITQGDAEFVVEGAVKVADAIVHKGKVTKGTIHKGEAIVTVDKARRLALARAHTATHLLQAALRTVLGPGVAQQGSLVDEDRFRFDFTHSQALSESQLSAVESLVNEYISRADDVCKRETTLDEAKKEGALAFFKDKYGAKVRLVKVSDYSMELCGGTHLDNTSQVGSFLIVTESSISSGIRRIEAVVGNLAYSRVRHFQDTIVQSAGLLRCAPAALAEAVRKVQEELGFEKKRSAQLEKELIKFESTKIIENAKSIQEIKFILHSFKDKDADVLMYLCDTLRNSNTSLFIFLVSSVAGKKMFVCAASDDVAAKGFAANKFVNRFKDRLSLKGGGRPTLVQGVLTGEEPEILRRIEECVSEFLKS